jgi:hypothetical protein
VRGEKMERKGKEVKWEVRTGERYRREEEKKN